MGQLGNIGKNMMKFDYLTDESQKSLAPFFSQKILSAVFHSVWIVSGLLALFWPRQHFFSFIGSDEIPALFFLIFSATLMIHSYVNLRCGRGEMNQPETYALYHQEAPAFEKENDFIRFGFIGFWLHTGFLILPFLPPLIISAAVSGVSMSVFMQGVSVVYTASMLCRMFGFTIYLFWGRSSTAGYLLARIFVVFFIFATLVFARVLNPLQILYKLNYYQTRVAGASMDSYFIYMAAVSLAILFLAALNQF